MGVTRMIAAVTAAALVFSGCSDDGQDASGSAPTPPTTAPIAAGPTATGSAGGDTSSSTSGPAASTPPGSSDAPEDDAGFVFGVLAPGAGDLAELAAGQARGLALALGDINAGGGVLGHDVAAVAADESIDEPLGETLDVLTEQGAAAILGPVSSASAAEVVELARERGLVVCSGSATAASLTTRGDAAHFFRTVLRDDHAAAALAERLMTPADPDDDAPRSVLILGRDDVYAEELAGALAADLTGHGARVDTLLYPWLRVDFAEEVAAVVAADPDLVVLAAFGEGVTLVADLVEAGIPPDRIVGLDGLDRPDLATLAFPDEPDRADGVRVIRATGDLVTMDRLAAVSADGAATLYGAQMYDCAITIALAAIAAGSGVPADIGAQIRAVTSRGRTCSTFEHCRVLLEAGEDIAYAGASGGLEIDSFGDIATTRLTTSTFVDGELVDTATDDIDLQELRRQLMLSAAISTTRLQQAMQLLGFFDGDVTGVFDDETVAALERMQAALGAPVTGVYDEATDTALRARLGSAGEAVELATRQLQLELQALGYYDGPIDGRFSAATIAAVRAFQARLGVPQTGLLDATTVRAIFVLGQQNPFVPPPPVPPPDPPSATTAPPVATAPPAPPTTPAATTEPPPPPATTEPSPDSAPEPEPEPESDDLLAVLSADPQLSTFLGHVRAAGLEGELTVAVRSFTLLAPTNAAFEALDPAELGAWTADPARLRALIAFHAVDPDRGILTAADFEPGPLRSAHGAPLDVDVDGSAVTVGGGVLSAPREASNGIVFHIDTVLVPPG